MGYFTDKELENIIHEYEETHHKVSIDFIAIPMVSAGDGKIVEHGDFELLRLKFKNETGCDRWQVLPITKEQLFIKYWEYAKCTEERLKRSLEYITEVADQMLKAIGKGLTNKPI
jgi:hypothetical protein